MESRLIKVAADMFAEATTNSMEGVPSEYMFAAWQHLFRTMGQARLDVMTTALLHLANGIDLVQDAPAQNPEAKARFAEEHALEVMEDGVALYPPELLRKWAEEAEERKRRILGAIYADLKPRPRLVNIVHAPEYNKHEKRDEQPGDATGAVDAQGGTDGGAEGLS